MVGTVRDGKGCDIVLQQRAQTAVRHTWEPQDGRGYRYKNAAREPAGLPMVGNKARLDVLMHIPFAFPDHQDSRESLTLLVNWSELDDLHAEKHLLISGTSDFNLKMASYSGKAVVVRRSCCAPPIVPAVSPPRRWMVGPPVDGKRYRSMRGFVYVLNAWIANKYTNTEYIYKWTWRNMIQCDCIGLNTMYDVKVWCMMYDVWRVMYIWCVTCDVWWCIEIYDNMRWTCQASCVYNFEEFEYGFLQNRWDVLLTIQQWAPDCSNSRKGEFGSSSRLGIVSFRGLL